MLHKRKRNERDLVKFNGNDLSSLVMCRVHRPIMATVDANFEQIGNRDGELFKYVRAGGYDLQIEIWLRAEWRHEIAEARHKLAAMLWTDEPAPLYLPDDPNRYLMAIVSGDTDLGEICDECPTTTLTFHIGDPFFYGAHRKQLISAGDVYLNVGGNRPAYLSVTAVPSAGDTWRLTNVDTGDYVELDATITAASVVRVDMETERATVNQATAAVTIASDFFSVEGRAHLKLSSGTATLEWDERWL